MPVPKLVINPDVVDPVAMFLTLIPNPASQLTGVPVEDNIKAPTLATVDVAIGLEDNNCMVGYINPVILFPPLLELLEATFCVLIIFGFEVYVVELILQLM